MTSEQRHRVELLQGTLDLIVLRALSTMGPQHAYGLAARLDQIADHPFPLNQRWQRRQDGDSETEDERLTIQSELDLSGQRTLGKEPDERRDQENLVF